MFEDTMRMRAALFSIGLLQSSFKDYIMLKRLGSSEQEDLQLLPDQLLSRSRKYHKSTILVLFQ